MFQIILVVEEKQSDIMQLTVTRSWTPILRESNIGGIDLRAMLREEALQIGQ